MLTGATQTITLIARSGQYHLRVVNTTTILMYQSMLEELGLSPNEAKIYETLVEKGEANLTYTFERNGKTNELLINTILPLKEREYDERDLAIFKKKG